MSTKTKQNEDYTTRFEAKKKRIIEQDKAALAKLAAEPKVKLIGDTLYKEKLGDSYSFLFNGRIVGIRFDGSVQEYPKTIADLLLKKLSAISKASTQVEINEEL